MYTSGLCYLLYHKGLKSKKLANVLSVFFIYMNHDMQLYVYLFYWNSFAMVHILVTLNNYNITSVI